MLCQAAATTRVPFRCYSFRSISLVHRSFFSKQTFLGWLFGKQVEGEKTASQDINLETQKSYYNELKKQLEQKNSIEVPQHLGFTSGWKLALYLHRLEKGQPTNLILDSIEKDDQAVDDELICMKENPEKASVDKRRAIVVKLQNKLDDVMKDAVKQALAERNLPIAKGNVLLNRTALQEGILGMPISASMYSSNGSDLLHNTEDIIETMIRDNRNRLERFLRKNSIEQDRERTLNAYNLQLRKRIKGFGAVIPKGTGQSSVRMALFLHRMEQRQACHEILVGARPNTQEVYAEMDETGKKTKNGIEKVTQKITARRKKILVEGILQALLDRGESTLGGKKALEIRLVESILGIPKEKQIGLRQWSQN